MKLQRLMLAVLAVCGTSAALAQSSVTLYGRVNTTVENWKFGSQKAITGLTSNSSYVGFRGVEDLGGGLKAGFILESKFGSDDGSGSGAGGLNFTRQSEVNLSGNFGIVRMGAYDPASYLAVADPVSMHNHDTGYSADALYKTVMQTGNQIAYRTPDFGGFNAEVQYSFGEKKVTDGLENKGAVDLALNYANGPLGLGMGYSRAKKDAVLLGADSNKEQQFGLRGSYAFGPVTLAAYYQYYKADVGTVDYKRHAARIAAMYTLGASEFHVNVGRANKIKDNFGTQAGTAATQWTLGYNYNLSKRTKLYGYYTKVNNGRNYYYGPEGGATGENFRSFAVGVRHLF